MPLCRLLSVIFCLAAITDIAAAQARIAGRIVEVIDARTFVLETGATRMAASVRSIRTPAPGHPLYNAVREHFSRLVLGKNCEFQPIAIAYGSGNSNMPAEGRLFIGGINIAGQMIRDGAAVYDPRGLSANETAEFEQLQELARAERRGVWAYPDAAEKLIDAAAFAAEEAGSPLDAYLQLLRQAAGGALPDAASSGRNAADSASSVISLWQAKGSATGEFSAYYDRGIRRGFTATGAVPLELFQARGIRAAYFRTMFLYSGSPAEFEDTAYALAFLISGDDYRFSDTTNLEIIADGQKLPIGVPLRLARRTSDGTEEVLFYALSRQTLSRLASARRLGLKISRYNGSIAGAAIPAIGRLLEITK